MMMDFNVGLYLLGLLCFIHVHGDNNTILDIHLSDLTTDNKLENGQCCQGATPVKGECSKPCHIVMTLCYGSFSSKCAYGSTSFTLTPSPTRKVSFGENLGNTTNPVILQIVRWKENKDTDTDIKTFVFRMKTSELYSTVIYEKTIPDACLHI